MGSFLSGIVAVIAGNILGVSALPSKSRTEGLTGSQYWLDRTKINLRTRARSAFFVVSILQGGWWIWATVLATRFRRTQPTYDWSDNGFGAAFALFLFLVIGFQINYLFL